MKRWVYTGGTKDGGSVVTEDGKYLVADSGDWGGLITCDDGHLMAAAPALADALEALSDAAECGTPHDIEEANKKARAALRAAKRLP